MIAWPDRSRTGLRGLSIPGFEKGALAAPSIDRCSLLSPVWQSAYPYRILLKTGGILLDLDFCSGKLP